MSEKDVTGPISKIEISPNGTYLVAAICNQDHKIQEIVGWNVKDDSMEKQVIFKWNVEEENEDIKVVVDIGESEDLEKEVKDIKMCFVDNIHMCVSDDMILAYIYYQNDDTNEFSKYN